MKKNNKEPELKEPKEIDWFADLGFCIHKWKFLRTERGEFKVVDVCECIKCGKRKGFKVW